MLIHTNWTVPSARNQYISSVQICLLINLFTRKKYRLYICERCLTESDQDISDEFIKRSIENKIQNYEQSLKTIEQQNDLIEALKKQLTIERTKHEKRKRELELKNYVSPKRQKELLKKVINLEERSLKDKEQLTD